MASISDSLIYAIMRTVPREYRREAVSDYVSMVHEQHVSRLEVIAHINEKFCVNLPFSPPYFNPHAQDLNIRYHRKRRDGIGIYGSH